MRPGSWGPKKPTNSCRARAGAGAGRRGKIQIELTSKITKGADMIRSGFVRSGSVVPRGKKEPWLIEISFSPAISAAPRPTLALYGHCEKLIRVPTQLPEQTLLRFDPGSAGISRRWRSRDRFRVLRHRRSGGRRQSQDTQSSLDARHGGVRRALKLKTVTLLNDLEAGAYGIFTLKNDEFYTLNEGTRPRQQGADRGRHRPGGSDLTITGTHFHPLASEGGHADFAPRNELEIELLRYLLARFGHVSYERLVSGPGLLNIYRFLKDARGLREPAWLTERLAGPE